MEKARNEKWKNKRTKLEGTLANCIHSGCKNPDNSVGIYTSDPDAHAVFAEVLDAIIMNDKEIDKVAHLVPGFGDVKNLNLSDLDPSSNLIVSTHVCVGRSHDSFGFLPVLKKEDCVKREQVSVEALKSLESELAGSYYPLSNKSPEVQKQQPEDHSLF
ncbi:arginine kinase [Octopus vulgaris]|uniref:Arginine kinase n=1 Tax=Octopus vulgaris TaxID=6645 RepID=A0AA36AY21_OCTVU|nr:arginine kinase [Octopus vulgaris]